jgi:hypothetical protein
MARQTFLSLPVVGGKYNYQHRDSGQDEDTDRRLLVDTGSTAAK